MRTLTWLGSLIGVVALGACDGPSVRIAATDEVETDVLRAVDSLNCPETQGNLTRTAIAADGLSCTYAGPRGSEVTLRLIRLDDALNADAALTALKTEVEAALPDAAARLSEEATAPEPQPATDSEAPATEPEEVVIRLPGVSIRASDDSGGRESADIAIGTGRERVNVTSRDEAVLVETRLTGDQTRLSYILIDERAAEGALRLSGFEARGPEGGPIVAAIVLSKDRRESGVFDAAKDLVQLNVGG